MNTEQAFNFIEIQPYHESTKRKDAVQSHDDQKPSYLGLAAAIIPGVCGNRQSYVIRETS